MQLLGPEKENKYVVVGEKAKAQLLRDSKKDIELIMTELQKNPLNYTQVMMCFLIYNLVCSTPTFCFPTFCQLFVEVGAAVAYPVVHGLFICLGVPLSNWCDMGDGTLCRLFKNRQIRKRLYLAEL